LDELQAAIYFTDIAGTVTHYNDACIAFAGRKPRVGHDTWCVTWKLYTKEGDFLPHDQCPMAVAIREQRPVRGIEAVAERPDGSHLGFRPYPTPLFDQAGQFVGAVNLLLDVGSRDQSHALRARAAKYRRMVNLMPDPQSRQDLDRIATSIDQQALRIERKS
jgi:PAS domain-containing protein